MPNMSWSHKSFIAGVIACCLVPGLAHAQQAAGEWRLDDSDGGIRVGYFDKSAAQPDDADPLLNLSCDPLNATLTGFYRTRTPSLVEAAQAGTLALQLTAAQAKAAIPAYATQAPGEDAVGFEAPFTPDRRPLSAPPI